MKQSISNLEDQLCEIHGKDYCVIVGNATLAIALILKVFNLKGKKIAIPNNVCVNVPMSVYFSGNNPKYLDITQDDFGLDPSKLLDVIHEVDVVIAVHAYGMPCRIKEIERICKNHNVLLIEDFCVAQGAKIDNINLGNFGDVSIVSFGSGKIVDVGHGGAILTNNEDVANELQKIITELPLSSSIFKRKSEELSDKHTKLYNKSYGKGLNIYANQFKLDVLMQKQYYYYQFDKNYTIKITNKLENLAFSVESRLEKNFMIVKHLSEINSQRLTLVDLPSGSVPWRSNILIHNIRNKVLKILLKKQYKVSSWYPSSDLFFESRKISKIETPISDWLGDNILNFWVNEEVDSKYIGSITEELKKLLI